MSRGLDAPELDRGLRPRPSRGIGSWPSIAVGAAVVLAGGLATAATAPCKPFHPAVELAGSDRRLASWIPDCSVVADIGEARATLAWDVLFIAGYVIFLASVLRRWWPLYLAPRLKGVEAVVIALPLVAGALDLVENLLIVLGLDVSDGRFAYPERLTLPIIIATVAWLKWMAAAAAVVAAVMAAMLAFARRHEQHRPLVRGERHHPGVDAASEPAELGVCCSGGGIRAAAFALGALERLEDGGVMAKARWLTAVSGGSYAATAWRLVKASDPSRPAAVDITRWLEHPIPSSPAGRHRFLRNGPGGLGRSVVAAIAYVAFNLAVLGALVFALAWPLGWVIGSDAVQPALRTIGDLPDRIDLPAELWLPGVLLFVVAAAVLAMSALPSWRVAALWRVAAILAALGVLLEVVLVVVPLAMVVVGQFLHGGTDGVRAGFVGAASFLGVAGTVWRIARKPLIGRLTSRLPELGGVLLGLVAVVWGGKVATDAAIGAGRFDSPLWWVVVTAAFVLVYAFVGITQLSIHRIYRKRLRRTFGLKRTADGALFAPEERDQLTWTDMPADNPELVICCAQQRTGIAPGGLPAETFTISRRHVQIGDDVAPTDTYLAKLSPGLCAERYVSSWTATSGAAFASAMGRLSKGSTNALLAALNIDLGIWLPNPRLVEDQNATFPRVRLGYLFKEILGWYDPADRYVFVADGGHWENLGLVELLRRRCATILCIDASGDAIGGFTTLRQAVELAELELPDVVAGIDLEGLQAITPADGAMPSGIVATLTVWYRGPGGRRSPGTIHYAKAQVARDLDIALRRFAKADRRFPDYSTGDQFLTDEQFRQLVGLGREAGDRLVDLTRPPGRMNA